MTLLGGGAVAWPLAARAQQHERVRRIGVLIPLAESDPEARSVVAAFVPGLNELGWTDGRSVRIDYRWAGGDAQRIQSFAKELVELQPNLIVARSSPVVAALLQQTRTIPIVFWQVIDPVSQAFVANLARPGGNVTGFTTFEPAMGSKWVEVLKEVMPGVARIALLFNPDTAPYVETFSNSVNAASLSLAVSAIKAPVRDAGEIERAIARFSVEPSGGMIVMPDAFTLFSSNW
jgi:putative ABC transport system substrate-binding protein